MDLLDRLLPLSILQHPRSLRRGRLIVGTCTTLIIVLSVGLIGRLLIGPLSPSALALAIISILALSSIPWVLRWSGSLVLAGWLTTCVFLVLIVTQMFWAGGAGSPVAVFVPMIPLLATHLVGPRTGRWTAGVLLMVIAVSIALVKLDVELPRRSLSADQDVLAHGLLLAVAMLLVATLASSYEHQRKVLEGELRQADALYRRLFDQSKDMVALAKPSGRLLDVNQAGVDLYGFPSREAFMKSDLRNLYIHPEQRLELIRRLERDGYVQNYESLQRGADGRPRTVQGTTTAVRNDRGEVSHFLTILRDITTERQAAEERDRMVLELERKNRDLEGFTYAVSHDLKSPLFTIRGFLEMLAEDAESGDVDIDRLASDVDQMLRTTDRMQALVDGLLELARIGAGKESWGPQSLSRIAAEAKEQLAGRLRQHGVVLSVQDDLPTVHGDPVLLGQLLQNLIDNAAKFLAGRDDPKIDIGKRLDGHREVIFVRDNGPGVGDEDKEKIFGLFSKLDHEGAGTGIGLAIVKRVVDLHGGEVWVESEGKGRGATFCFTLPNPGSASGE